MPSKRRLQNIKHREYVPSVRYTVGQPMGALSSWAMLAITHHFIVQSAAWMAGVVKTRTMFSKYAVLGDDIVIWDKATAEKYQ